LTGKIILTPVSWLYGFITGFRNFLYDRSLLKIFHPDIPVIVAGNLIAGGTGKTPLVAWIAGELAKKYRVAILSRGYGRITRDFQVLDDHSTPETVGDEPMELRLLLPGIIIAVDRNRKRGILNLTSGKYGKIDVIIMDDGFQHRAVKPGFSIILDDYNRPFRKEKLIPAGLRREPLSGMKRADMVIETKKVNQNLPFTLNNRIILVTGIANPKRLVEEIYKTGNLYHHLKFPDHYRYRRSDAATILKLYNEVLAENQKNRAANQLKTCNFDPVILTTGKDFVKLSRLPELIPLNLQWIRSGPPVDPEQKQNILKKINEYVEKTYPNS
jgi:tetraacyldisaccharide 4'-kinase